MTAAIERNVRDGFRAVVMVIGLSTVAAPPLAGREIWVDPDAGDDLAAGERDAPVKTVSLAFELAAGEVTAEIHLLPGIYRGGSVFHGLDETFPWVPPPMLRELVIQGRVEDGRKPRVEVVDEKLLGIDFDASRVVASGATLDVRLENLELSGGRAAFSIVGPSDGELDLTLESCSFEGFAGSALEVFAGPRSRTRLSLRDCRFERSGGGVLLETLEGAEAEIDIRESFFSEVRGVGFGGLLGGAIEVHVDSSAIASGSYSRNVFRDTANAFIFTASDGALALRARIAHSLLYTRGGAACAVESGSSEDCGLLHAVYLSHAGETPIDVLFENDTFFGVERQLVYQDNLEEGEVPGASVRIERSIIGESAERPSGSLAGELGVLPAGFTVTRSIVPEEWLALLGGAGKNSAEDPGFADPAEDDFRLRADSPALDAGGIPAELESRDLDGRCRLAAAGDGREFSVDLGAYEYPGRCDPTLLLSFVRADCNLDSRLELTDAIVLLDAIFLGEGSIRCADACDATDDGRLDVSDGISLLSFLFQGGRPPAPPYPEAGKDTTPDGLPDCLAR